MRSWRTPWGWPGATLLLALVGCSSEPPKPTAECVVATVGGFDVLESDVAAVRARSRPPPRRAEAVRLTLDAWAVWLGVEEQVKAPQPEEALAAHARFIRGLRNATPGTLGEALPERARALRDLHERVGTAPGPCHAGAE